MNEDFEARLRQHLQSVEQAPVVDADIAINASIRRWERRRARRRAAAAVACVGLTALGVVVIASHRSSPPPRVASPTTQTATTMAGTVEQLPTTVVPTLPPSIVSSPSIVVAAPTTATATTTASATGSLPVPTTATAQTEWRPIALDPRGSNFDPAVVWDGSEALVVGGLLTGDGSSQKVSNAAAAYSPATGTWRLLSAPPPTGGRTQPLAVWTGTEMLIIGGDNPDGSLLVSYGQAYNPTTDTWRTTASPPIGFLSDRSPSAWDGTELLVWPWNGGDSTTQVRPLAYNPGTDTWRAINSGPSGSRENAASVWTGSEWMVFGGTDGKAEYTTGLIYNPTTDSWRKIADSPLAPRQVAGVWTGSEMIVYGGRNGSNMAFGDGAAYNPTTDHWRRIAGGPAHPGFQAIWTATALIEFAKGHAVVYFAESDRWTQWAGDPKCFSGKPVWTGSEALIFGCGNAEVGGMSYTPPAP
jgi:N-acetylneuraminic acid mutarotase